VETKVIKDLIFRAFTEKNGKLFYAVRTNSEKKNVCCRFSAICGLNVEIMSNTCDMLREKYYKGARDHMYISFKKRF
jgi:hypothetical protein